MANIRQALHTAIKALSTVTDLLGDGANSVLPRGRVKASTPCPCIVVAHIGRGGGPRRLPFFDDLYALYVYDDAPAGVVSYVKIDAILEALRKGIHGASLTVTGEERVFNCMLDNNDGPDQWDEVLQKAYKMVRLRISGTLRYDYRS